MVYWHQPASFFSYYIFHLQFHSTAKKSSICTRNLYRHVSVKCENGIMSVIVRDETGWFQNPSWKLGFGLDMAYVLLNYMQHCSKNYGQTFCKQFFRANLPVDLIYDIDNNWLKHWEHWSESIYYDTLYQWQRNKGHFWTQHPQKTQY